MADQLIGHFVDQARRSGASWTEIGGSMGVSKQAAQKRFVRKDAGAAPPLDPSQGFSRFTPEARSVVVAAQEAARSAGNATIQPAHLVLALLDQPDTPATRRSSPRDSRWRRSGRPPSPRCRPPRDRCPR